jgi:hypothetical protein
MSLQRAIARPRVVYVAGYGRSGSTVLDVLLGSAEGAIGAGEVCLLARAGLSPVPCSCGQDAVGCPLWSEVLARIGGAKRPERLIHAQAVSAISEVTGANVVIDSSKTAWRRLRRPRQLSADGFHLNVVHLVRHPASVAGSVAIGRNQDLAHRQDATRARGVPPWLFWPSWVVANRAASAAVRGATSTSVTLAFEQLLAEPLRTTLQLAESLELDLGAACDAIAEGRPLPRGHGLAGNRHRAAHDLVIRRTEATPSRLSPSAQLAARLGGLRKWPELL